MISDAEKLARAVLLFFAGGAWTENDQELWRELTSTDNATSRTLCDLARKVRDMEERINQSEPHFMFDAVARACAQPIRGCATDEQYNEVISLISKALRRLKDQP